MSKFAIIAIGYNRADSMARLLTSLAKGHYSELVDLIVSIDNSGTSDVKECADRFEWKYGEKIVRTFAERQGLRKHILACGDYLEKYDALAVFEDDIVVSPTFFDFFKEAYEFYKDDDRIAGISLYAHAWNVNAVETFYPEPSEFDTYFIQFAQSWGQIWLKKQWFEFKKWLEDNGDEVEYADDIPTFVSNWPKNSWLKYHIKYCIREKKYFVYPYVSLTTCFSDVGEHQKYKNTLYQVPISMRDNRSWRFAPLNGQSIKYDAFFEREGLNELLGIPEGELVVDLYGTKESLNQYRYILSTKPLPFQVIKSFGLQCRPHEVNIEIGNNGRDIFLYDSTTAGEMPDVHNYELKQFCYHQRMLFQNRRMLMLLVENLKSKILGAINRKR